MCSIPAERCGLSNYEPPFPLNPDMFALYEIYMRDVRGLGDAPMLGGGDGGTGLGWILWAQCGWDFFSCSMASSMTRFCWPKLPWNLSKIWVWRINFLLMWPFSSILVEHLKLPTLFSFILSLILHTHQATKSKDEGGDFCNLVGRQFTVFLGNKPLKPDL